MMTTNKPLLGATIVTMYGIMARTPTISQEDYSNLVTLVGALGYDLDALRKSTHSSD